MTWAFEFENQPYFEGFRTLATNGIDKPVLNVFRMFGMMGSERIALRSNSNIGEDSVLRTGVSGRRILMASPLSKRQRISVIIWNYHDQDVAVPAANVES